MLGLHLFCWTCRSLRHLPKPIMNPMDEYEVRANRRRLLMLETDFAVSSVPTPGLKAVTTGSPSHSVNPPTENESQYPPYRMDIM